MPDFSFLAPMLLLAAGVAWIGFEILSPDDKDKWQ